MILLGISMVMLAGLSNAVMDKLQFHWHWSIFSYYNTVYKEQFWNPKESWKNKYKSGTDYQIEKFKFSTTLLVFLTDAWHLFQMLHTLLLFAGVSLIGYFSNNYLELFIYVLISRIIYGLTFELFFKIIFEKK